MGVNGRKCSKLVKKSSKLSQNTNSDASLSELTGFIYDKDNRTGRETFSLLHSTLSICK